VDRIAYRIDMRERAMAIAPQPAITKDNVSVDVSGILYIQFVDPAQAAYGSFSASVGGLLLLLAPAVGVSVACRWRLPLLHIQEARTHSDSDSFICICLFDTAQTPCTPCGSARSPRCALPWVVSAF
jgi:hypothetical protein